MDAVSVVAASGFGAAGVAAGIKPDGALDLALVAAEVPVPAAAVFTTNRAAAAPVRLSRLHLVAGDGVRAVVLNSGCANAATGPRGDDDALTMARLVAERLRCGIEEVLVCSTGPIGSFLPIDRVAAGIDTAATRLGTRPEDGLAAARAIMTTDTVPKEIVVRGGGFTVGGMAKGAGMLRPDMATMLVVLTTDAVADESTLDEALRTAVDTSFHSLNVDGCPSTNDAVIVLASGASGTRPELEDLAGALVAACAHLAEQLAADAEGASRVVTIDVVGAASDAVARAAGRVIADSALVRAAFYGGDPNWGRILAALGTTDLPYEEDGVAVAFDGVVVAESSQPAEHDEEALLARLAEGDFTVTVRLGDGPGRAAVLTTDLTPEYVRFNGERS